MKTLPLPVEDEVHLYLLSLSDAFAELTRFEQHLTRDEAARAALLKREQLRYRFVMARGILREILGSYLGIVPHEVPMVCGKQGKPFLSEDHEALRFNLSHSGDFCLIACSTNREVGVDLEMINPDKPLRDMARLVFSHNEQQELFDLRDSAFEAAFYRLWVRKEACLKACGTGFALPPGSFDLSPSIGKRESIVSCNRKDWHVLELEAPRSCCAAIAIERLLPGEKPPRIVRGNHQPFNSVPSKFWTGDTVPP